MAIAFVAVNSIVNNNATVNVPAGLAGDTLILCYESDTASDVAAAAGWAGNKSTYNSATRAIGYLVKNDATTGGGTQAFTGLSAGFFEMFMIRYRGVDSVTPVHKNGFDQASGSPITMSTLTSTIDGCMEFAAQSWDAGIPTTAAPGGWTRRVDGSSQNYYAAERAQATQGATGTTAFTNSNGGQVGGIHLLLAPSSVLGFTVIPAEGGLVGVQAALIRPPDAPTALTPTAGDTQVVLAWTAPAFDGGSAITDYIVEYRIKP